MPERRDVRAVLFDLDGTFADTAPDLAYALNETLRRFGEAELPYARIRPHVSHGATALIRLGFRLEPAAEAFEERRQVLLRVYQENLCRATRPFDGIAEVLDVLEANALAWGIVTNKPSWLTDPLMAQLGLAARAGCVVSGDTTPTPKPHPAPILHACAQLGVQPERCVYVGDAARDVEAGRRAGAATLAATFGYLQDHEDPATWGADGLIATPLDLLDWLGIATHG
jgi:N-acetyl-D-muramate 6-phosphate phosphatase